MELLITFGVIIAAPIALLLWTRRDTNPHEPRTEPRASREPGAPGNGPRADSRRDYGADSTL